MSYSALPEGWTRPILAASWDLWASTLQPPSSPVLYHYTTTDALIEIVGRRKMWATNLMFANDPAELVHAHDVIRKAVTWATETYCASRPSDHILRKWIGSFDEIMAMVLRETDFYSVSLCEEGDLLSQWRSYGSSGGGFAIGWHAASKFPAGGRRAAIEYREQEQERLIRETLRLHIEALLAYGPFETREDWAPYHKALSYSLGLQITFYLYAFKHPAYASEREFRLIYTVEKDSPPPGAGPYFRRFATMVKPYIEVDFGSATLDEVVYGPTTDPGLTERWLRQFLDVSGYAATKIRRSAVPMR